MEIKDDTNIADAARLWRRIHPLWYQTDPQTGVRRLTSQAFADSVDGSSLSVVLADRPDAPSNPRQWLSRFPEYGVAELTAGSVRRCNQCVIHTPMPNEPAHGSIVGKKTGAVRNRLRDSAKVLIEPTGP